MKKIKLIGLAAFAIILSSNVQAQKKEVKVNSNADYTVYDLNTGEMIVVYYDDVKYQTFNKASNTPVDYYIVRYKDNSMADTVHGVTGIIVNGMLWKDEEGKWELNDAVVKWDGDEWKMKDKYGRKVKWEKGELKIKDWNNKFKSEEGDDVKYKEEWDKVKWKDDEVKVEKGTKKTKTKY